MVEFATKYFGKIDIGGQGNTILYDDQEIRISLSDCSLYGDKVKVCLEIMDKYVEINEIAKNAILENFPKNKIILGYFKDHFEDYGFTEEQIMEIFGVNNFEEMDIKNIVEQLEYPNLLFSMENDEIEVSVDYMVSKKYSDEILCVKMDKQLNITDFTHES
jgi:hypothetical protein